MNNQSGEVGQLHEVRGTFTDSAHMQHAVETLLISGFDRAEMSLSSKNSSLNDPNPDTASKPASTEADARQARTLGSSTAAAAAAMAAVGITVATGGAAVPALAAAVLVGGAAGGVTFAATGAATQSEQQDRDTKAASGELWLSVRTITTDKQQRASQILEGAGATHIETI